MKKIVILLFTVALLGGFCFYSLDTSLRNKRIQNHQWESKSGFWVQDVISKGDYSISGDTMVFKNGYRCLIARQYFNTLILRDIKTGRDGTYIKFQGSKRW